MTLRQRTTVAVRHILGEEFSSVLDQLQMPLPERMRKAAVEAFTQGLENEDTQCLREAIIVLNTTGVLK